MSGMKAWLPLAALTVVASASALALLGLSTHAASPPPPAPPPVSATPQTTTASFGDWTVRCVSVGAKRQCEASLSLAVVQQGRQIPIAQIAFGHSNDARRTLLITALLPVNVSFDKPARIGPDETHLTTLVYRRCVPAGCLASAAPEAALVALARTAQKPGRLVFADASERLAVLPVSFRGLAQALDALAKESSD